MTNTTTTLTERLLGLMDQKDHWAWVRFTEPGLTKNQLLVHFAHEYQTYVRDFPALLARVMGQFPPEDVRAALAENIFEEQTGKLSIGRSHPALFLEMMEGLGFSPSELDRFHLEPEAVAYRKYLDEVTGNADWTLGCAVMTIFVEGSRHEREELEGTRKRLPPNEAVKNHPLVKYYGCPPECMKLTQAHTAIEGSHRKDAWDMIHAHIPDQGLEADRVVESVEKALSLWKSYRDGVARKMSL